MIAEASGDGHNRQGGVRASLRRHPRTPDEMCVTVDGDDFVGTRALKDFFHRGLRGFDELPVVVAL
ncbi:MAG TPA: hypothetical protein VGM94_02235 [Galbitalea sp.]